MVHPPYPVILASGSPRRKDLLSHLIETFEVVVPDVDEDDAESLDPRELAEGLALAKAQAVFHHRPEALVIGGDTVVAVPKDICGLSEKDWGPGHLFDLLAKPADEDEARAMLRRLSGRTHLVVTGFALLWPGGSAAGADASYVAFRDLSDEEIAAYVATGEPMDKAGAYGIQGYARDFVSRIEGSVSNVTGLPLEKLEQALLGLERSGLAASTDHHQRGKAG